MEGGGEEGRILVEGGEVWVGMGWGGGEGFFLLARRKGSFSLEVRGERRFFFFFLGVGRGGNGDECGGVGGREKRGLPL